MTKEVKRPTSNISGNSIKPALSESVEFYIDNNRKAYECIREQDEYIDYLESKLSNAKPQQALPVVPDYVGNAVMKINLEHLFTGYTNGINGKAKNWLERHKGVKSLGYYVCQLRFQGFTIEKPQLFYLKNKLTRKYLRKSKHTKDDWNEDFDRVETVNNKTKFTQAEIDSMETGSYEQIEVAE
ncbi:DUF1642 domain-containing protein [Lactococcus lactis]|uniref:Orf27 n=1 Tax=Lactococcus lactis subsp. lactis A12 TaxID=1137134 RepID=S6FSH3_LACLL|nr:DUF1642 domain-containing protein [Lactococcus lactis]CDG04132.1 Orf27 [Lactococcus lactis subsp. lactis A12]SBW31178.1 Orf27 [Lactococcus lactis subsp. lactis]